MNSRLCFVHVGWSSYLVTHDCGLWAENVIFEYENCIASKQNATVCDTSCAATNSLRGKMNDHLISKNTYVILSQR